MSNELIDELNEYADHCASSGQFQASDLISRAVAALQPSLPQEIQVPIAWARPTDINAAMIATRGERAEIAPDMEPGFTVPLYLYPSSAQPSLQQDSEPENLGELLESSMVSTGEIVPDKPSHPQDVEEWIEHIDKSGIWWDGHRHVRLVDVRAFLAGKVLVPVEPTQKMIDAGYGAMPDCKCTDGQKWRAALVFKAMLTASKGE